MNTSTFRWLLAQLPTWVQTEKISAADAERIRSKYIAELKYYDRTSATSMPLALISLLSIAVVWLFVDYWGWQGLAGGLRIVLATLPWLLSSVALVWVFHSGHRWANLLDVREAAALMHGFACALSIGLFSQIEQLNISSTQTSALISAWLITQLPLLLLTRSIVMLFACLFACVINYRLLNFEMAIFWLVFVSWSAYAYYLVHLLRQELPRIAVLCWWVFAANLTISIVLEVLFGGVVEGSMVIAPQADEAAVEAESMEIFQAGMARLLPAALIASCVFAAFIGASRMYLTDYARPFNFRLSARPLEVIGGAGIVLSLWLLQAPDTWVALIDVGQEVFGDDHSNLFSLFSQLSATGYALLVLSVLAWIFVIVQQIRSRDLRAITFQIAPVLILFGCLLATIGVSPDGIGWFYKIYVALGIAAWMMALGTITGRYIVLDSGVVVMVFSISVILISTFSFGTGNQVLILLAAAALLLAAHFIYFRKLALASKRTE